MKRVLSMEMRQKVAAAAHITASATVCPPAC
jgi:hypothetical protein